MLKDTKASCRGLDRLNPAVESGGRSVADRVTKPCHDSIDRFSSNRATFLIGASLLRIVDGYHDSKKARPPIASVSCQRHRNSSYRLQERLGAVVLFRSASRRFKQQILHIEVTTCDDPARIQAHNGGFSWDKLVHRSTASEGLIPVPRALPAVKLCLAVGPLGVGCATHSFEP